MDVHSITIAPDDDLIAYFVTRPGEFPWPADVCEQIRARRAAMSGQLFFDILLQLGGVDDPASIYPPTSLLGLKRLLDAIVAASYDSMKRDCLVYYLLKQNSDGKEVGYVSEKVISSHYVSLADAYWELDSGINVEGAISKLSDARIVKEYTSKIIETLGLESNSSHLIRKFVRTCRPPLRELGDMERYIIAIAEHSIVEAWKYQRTFPSNYPARKTLLCKLLSWTLTPKPKSPALKQLLALPFSKYEDVVLKDFAEHPPEDLSATSVEVIRDLVCVRLIQSCKYAAAVRFDRQYPSSAAAPRGTWGAERGRIVKEILSIMPRIERDSLENEAIALDQDARIRNFSKRNMDMNQSWTNLSASGSTDIGASWEDLGSRTTVSGPRRSFGGRTRTSLPNGTPAKPMFTPGASTSSSWTTQPQPRPQPLSAQSTLVSQNSAATSADSPLRAPFSPFGRARINPGESPAAASAARLFAQKSPSAQPAPQPQTNGVTNGAQTPNTSKSRNAFFEPDVESRTPSPVSFAAGGTSANASRRASPKCIQSSPATRLPTAPQDEIDEAQERSPTEEEQVSPVKDQAEVISSTSAANEDHEEQTPVARGGLRFSLFGGAAVPASTPEPVSKSAPQRTPPSNEVSPSNRRKYQDEGSENQRKKLKVSVPGAFNSDADDEHEHEHEREADLPSATSATVDKHPGRTTTRRTTPSRTLPSRRSSRKRSASPEEEEFDSHPFSIPGTLYEEDEDEFVSRRPNGNAKSARNNQQNGHGQRGHSETDDAGSEEADQVAPLPKHRHKASLAASLNAVGSLRTPRRGGNTRSVRGSSVEADTPYRPYPQSTGRPVRRSSRLQSAEVSPTADQYNKTEKKLKEKEKETRPRKRTRTTGAGATATGRGSTKRR